MLACEGKKILSQYDDFFKEGLKIFMLLTLSPAQVTALQYDATAHFISAQAFSCACQKEFKIEFSRMGSLSAMQARQYLYPSFWDVGYLLNRCVGGIFAMAAHIRIKFMPEQLVWLAEGKMVRFRFRCPRCRQEYHADILAR